jgi:glycosyltransferase involved in cell wall biosynthesis
MKNNEDVLFVFTGNGQKVNQIKSEINNSKLDNIRFYDYLEGQDYIDMLNVADVHVISLVEGIAGMAVPSKTYSYMAIGRPLIAILPEHTDIAMDIMNYELGCVVNTNNIDKFVSYVDYLLKNKNEVVLIGNRVLEVFNDNYTREKSTDKYYELIKEIIS